MSIKIVALACLLGAVSSILFSCPETSGQLFYHVPEDKDAQSTNTASLLLSDTLEQTSYSKAFQFEVFKRLQESAIQRSCHRLAENLSDEALVSCLLMTALSGGTTLHESDRTLLARYKPAAVMFFAYNVNQEPEGIKALLHETEQVLRPVSSPFYSLTMPTIFAVDHEGGLVHRFGAHLSHLPAAREFRADTQAIETAARLSGKELALCGFNLLLAPVAESLPHTESAFMGSRLWSSDPLLSGKAAAAFVRGMWDAGVFCTLKHFPGNSAADTHTERSTLNWTLSELFARARSFYQPLQENGSVAIMPTHAVLTALDEHVPGTLSKRLLSDWLKRDLGFSGILLADDLRMRAIAELYPDPGEAAVQAVLSGVDMLMVWPKDLSRIHAALYTAIRNGRLDRARVIDAATRGISLRMRIKAESQQVNSTTMQDTFLEGFFAAREETKRFLIGMGYK